VLKTFDGAQRWIVTLPIMDRMYYAQKGYIYYPSYRHMFVDTDLTHVAELEGKLIMRNDIIFKHSHYSTGETPKDELNERNDRTWNQGMAVYLHRVRERFGLPEGINVFDLCFEAKHHIQWLQKALQS